jgi:hypothetical protein
MLELTIDDRLGTTDPAAELSEEMALLIVELADLTRKDKVEETLAKLLEASGFNEVVATGGFDFRAETGHIVVSMEINSVVTAPSLAGQFVTSGAQDVILYMFIE